MKLSAAIGCCSDSIYFCIGTSGDKKIISENAKSFPSGNASLVFQWMEDSLEKKGYSCSNVKEWTLCTGPASFSRLRIISSLIKGITFRNDNCRCRGIPTAVVVAEAYSSVMDENTVVLFMAGGREMFFFGLRKVGKSYQIFEKDFLKNPGQIFGYKKIFVFEEGRGLVTEFLKDSIEHVVFINELPLKKVVFPEKNSEWDRKSMEQLFYMRPPVSISIHPQNFRTASQLL